MIMTQEITAKIQKAKESMDCQEFIKFLMGLDNEGKIYLDYLSFDVVIDYATRQAEGLYNSLHSGEWFGAELNCLNALEELPESEYDYIRIDAYGYPKSFASNQEVVDEIVIK